MKGVINLRGVIVPVVDLRVMSGVSEPTHDELTSVIILNIANRIVGVAVDSVSDVMELQPEEVRPAPAFSSTLDSSYIDGFGVIAATGQAAERMLILMDIERLMLVREVGFPRTGGSPAG